MSTTALEVGAQLLPWELPVTSTLVVSTAIATRDFQDVHHDRDLAHLKGSRDIFLNILTTTGLVQRYVTDQLGHDVLVRNIAIRLGAPAYPYDTLTFTGCVREEVETEGEPRFLVDVREQLARRPRHRNGHGRAEPGGGPVSTSLDGRAAIVGIGATEFSKNSGRSELQLSGEATRSALADAGLAPSDVDGLVTFTMDTVSEIALARELGIPELRFFSRVNYGGGGACGTVLHAAMAVATGVADVVVCYRGFNERSGSRFGQVSVAAATQVNTNGLDNAWTYPMGLGTPAATVAMFARRYMHDSGATTEDFGRVAVADRKHAANNPHAWFHGKPITLEDHQASRMIVDPLHLLDCCQESDGAVALVVTSAERARDLPQAPAVIRAAAQGSGPGQFVMTSYYRDEIGLQEMGLVGRELWRRSGLRPEDMDTAVLYDHFTPFVLMQLEELGFCGRGEARDFITDGAIEIGGRLPLNTHGGQLGEAYIHGMNGIAEGVRQMRGTSVNQVEHAQHVLVTAGTGVPTSGLVLGRD